MSKKIVIIGGGIAGLATAYSIREHQELAGEAGVDKSGGIEVLLIERKDQVGGNIRTDFEDGFLVEGGPDCFISDKPWAMQLCKRIGLEDELLPTNDRFRKTFVLSGGKLHDLPEGVILMVPTKILPLATSTLISWRGKLRMAMEYFIPKRRNPGDESLGEFVRRRLGQEALDKIAEPLIAGIHAGDPDTMSIRSSFPKFVEMEQQHGSLIKGMLKRMAQMKKGRPGGGAKPAPGAAPKKKVTMFMSLKGGMVELTGTLVDKITAFKDTEIRTGVNALGVEKKGNKYIIPVEGAEPIEADAVIVAAPAYAASSILDGFDGELSKRLQTIPYVSTATVSVAYKKKDLNKPLEGFGFVIPKVEKRRIMAATYTSVKFSGRCPDDSVLLRCFVGGSKNMELVNLDDEAMERLVREELRDILGITAEPVLVKVYRWIKAMPQYTIGHIERVEGIEEQVATHPGLFLTGSAYHGIGISDSVRIAEVVAKKAIHFVQGGEGAKGAKGGAKKPAKKPAAKKAAAKKPTAKKAGSAKKTTTAKKKTSSKTTKKSATAAKTTRAKTATKGKTTAKKKTGTTKKTTKK